MIYVMLPPNWLRDEDPNFRPIQLECSLEEALEYNASGYNVYTYPNYPSIVHQGFVKAEEVDIFEWVFVDLDLKHGAYGSKEEFIELLLNDERLTPTKIVDSGNGIHAYYRVSDLSPKSFLSLSRRLARLYNTDLAVQQLKQLMRVPGTFNTKDRDEPKECILLLETDLIYTCEQLDKVLPHLLKEDADYCQEHYDRAHNPEKQAKIDDKLPIKFGKLLQDSQEVKDIWQGNTDDRSKSDWRLAHIMLASGFTKNEALSVLVNSAKALTRGSTHRVSYATGIVDKIYTFEEAKDKESLGISSTVRDILDRHGDQIKGTRFPCWKWLDNTHHGFRLGQVLGLVAGSGVGKTAVALDMFMGWVELNPDLHHVFVPLEQPSNEIAERWRDRCGDKTHLHSKVHLISNYDNEGNFRNLSLEDIKTAVLEMESRLKIKIGCVVIDHIGALKKKGKNGENQDLMDICHSMKAFAIQTNTYLVMQSQAPREKAGIGDLELNKDSAYGTVFFESYCDYLVSLWQPLKRCYSNEDCPTVTAFKFCKIRHKKRGLDTIQEDVPYRMYFNPDTGSLRQMTELEEKHFDFFNHQATNKRKKDRKTDVLDYVSAKTGEVNGKIDSNSNITTAKSA